jgi:hypothetical protein
LWQLYDEIISTLFTFYRSTEKKLKYFTIQFIPSLVYVYLNQVHAQMVRAIDHALLILFMPIAKLYWNLVYIISRNVLH